MNSHPTVVAIVDDDPRLLESLEDLLESAGHAVHTFSSAGTFLAQGRLSEIDCLITDIGMPVVDGFDLQRMVNAKRPDLPVIFITGRHEFASQRRVAELARGRFFQKPFDGQALLAAVDEILRASS